jgi:hypothetical protein
MLSIIDKYYNWFGFNYLQKNNESILLDTTCPVDTVGEERPTDYYSDDEESDEGDNEEVISTYSLASLWENPQDDEKIIQDLIVDYINSYLPLDGQGSLEHINQYNNIYNYFGKTTKEEDERLLKLNEDNVEFTFNLSNALKIKNKINRDPIIMKSVFYTYKSLLYKSLSQENYYKADVNNYVYILILSYNDIQSHDDSQRILKIMHEKSISKGYGLIDAIKQMISDDYKKEYENIHFGNGTKVRDDDLFWAYTFWSRRYNEGNIKEVYDILVEVQNHYSKN